MPRKPRFTKKQVRDAIVNKLGIITDIAKELSCDTKTIYNYLGKYPELEEALSLARKNLTDLLDKNLLRLALNAKSEQVQLNATVYARSLYKNTQLEEDKTEGEEMNRFIERIEKKIDKTNL